VKRGELTTSDDELMVQGAGGQEEAFQVLVERWQTPVFAFMLRMLGSREDAQDLCQETFLRMIRSAGTYRPEGQFRSWLFRIAGNLARSRLRRRKILRWLSFENTGPDPPTTAPDAQQELEREQMRAAVRRAIAKLPDRQRQALILRQYQDLKCGEIADVMGLSNSAVQMLLHRAMLALRKDLGRDRGDR
jgi:RNA polymerase sigma-70 factor (ECF subfamily)